MAVKTIQATEWTCDGCGKTETVPLAEQPRDKAPKGWVTGTANDEHLDVVFHSHTSNCVGRSVANAFAEKNREES